MELGHNCRVGEMHEPPLFAICRKDHTNQLRRTPDIQPYCDFVLRLDFVSVSPDVEDF
jgi:hypothetical protein